ncbi:DUF4097 family beta strand repeat protein [Streptomyces sp. 110]|uniref:DUF4097 family beta strand repeat protein n=1 Tax=Streptomyces endocoffeicus TaxID=2898945 RepID=A0ABS1Q8Y6_9ACTN|nr:DUF4097 family beta strand repeat-containing protein [Streptomyces endocoffeicus]MBL1120804.1 DUF4097 family beta strand repeat protein [Streptomyces endocoffeicus]
MPAYETPEPISVTIELPVGDIRIVAGDRADTVVTVVPTDAKRDSDAKAAERVSVDYSGGRLLVKAPKQYLPFGHSGSSDVCIEMPAGSQLRGTVGSAALRCDGRLALCHFKSGMGDIELDETDSLYLEATSSDITVRRVHGRAEVILGSGAVRLAEIDGPSVIKNTNGDVWVGVAHDDARLTAANGSVSLDRAHGSVEVKVANGSIGLGEVQRGSIGIETGVGELEVGIREGTAARLDLRTRRGTVRNYLTSIDGPMPTEETVEVRARTSMGDIVIRRA